MDTYSKENKWDNLSMADRASYIKLALDNGIMDLKVVRDTYNQVNKYPDGGDLDYNMWPKGGNREHYTTFIKNRYGENYQKDWPSTGSYAPFFGMDYAQRAARRHPQATLNNVLDVMSTTPIESRASYNVSQGGSEVGGSYNPNTGAIIMNSAANPNPSYFAHELSHAMDYRLNLSEGSGASQDETDLKLAYPLLDDSRERRAVNTQLRYQLYNNSGRLTGDKLDSYIDNLNTDDLKSAIESIGTSYIKGRQVNDGNLQYIKNALKNVAMNTSTPYTNYAADGGFLDWIKNLFNKPVGYITSDGRLVEPGRTIHNPKTGKYYTVQKDGTLKRQPVKRRKPNTSPTAKESTAYEDAAHKMIYRNNPDTRYSIPYIEEKVVRPRPRGSTLRLNISTNALDSIAKYAGRTDLGIVPAIGLAYKETTFGRQPYFNYKTDSNYNRIIGNMNYFQNFESIPAEFLVRDYEYHKGGRNKGRKYTDKAPLEHAFEYFKSGNYNRGDPNHTSDTYKLGNNLFNTPEIQEWWRNSGKKFYYNK